MLMECWTAGLVPAVNTNIVLVLDLVVNKDTLAWSVLTVQLLATGILVDIKFSWKKVNICALYQKNNIAILPDTKSLNLNILRCQVESKVDKKKKKKKQKKQKEENKVAVEEDEKPQEEEVEVKGEGEEDNDSQGEWCFYKYIKHYTRLTIRK